MAFRIGPIELPYHENLGWSDRRRNNIVAIPMGRSTGYMAGTELTGYRIQSAFHADTDAEAKLLRRQLHELAKSQQNFIYMDFDLDDREHAGWFLLDEVSTEPLPAVFGDYPVSLSGQRLGGTGDFLLGTYWKDNDLTNDWSFSGTPEVALPNGAGDASLTERSGEGGSSRIILDPSDQLIIYPLPDISNFYGCRCRIRDTVGEASESDWEDVYGPGHEWQEHAVFDNGLIRFKWDSSTHKTSLHIWLYAIWAEGAQDYELFLNDGVPTQLTAEYPPIITHFDWDRVEWQLVYTDGTEDYTVVNFALNRGSLFLSMEIKTGANGLHANSGLRTKSGITISTVYNSSGSASPTVGLPLDANSNFATGALSDGTNIGFLYTDQPAGQPPAGTTTKMRQGTTVAANSIYRQALVAHLTNPATTNYGPRYLANVRQQLVLVNPKLL